jgi:hypothetical protein
MGNTWPTLDSQEVAHDQHWFSQHSELEFSRIVKAPRKGEHRNALKILDQRADLHLLANFTSAHPPRNLEPSTPWSPSYNYILGLSGIISWTHTNTWSNPRWTTRVYIAETFF